MSTRTVCGRFEPTVTGSPRRPGRCASEQVQTADAVTIALDADVITPGRPAYPSLFIPAPP
ncbi:hypothetical protein N566_00390 [Streptomycetaceae bacterium MP113-05]|nr:hypothetical protein N566_00390 [Streptomycetaceae bacterium MP113-05]